MIKLIRFLIRFTILSFPHLDLILKIFLTLQYPSIYSFLRRHSHHFIIHRFENNWSVLDVNFPSHLFPVRHACNGVLQPLLVQAFRAVIPCMRTAWFLSVFSAVDGLRCAEEQVFQFQGLDQVGVESQGAVGDTNIVLFFTYFTNFSTPSF